MFIIDFGEIKFDVLDIYGGVLDRIGDVGVLWILLIFIVVGSDGCGFWFFVINFGVFGDVDVGWICVV